MRWPADARGLRRRQLGAAALSTLLPAWSAAADEAAPPEIAGALPDARLRGSATMRFLTLRIYEIRLWAAADFAAAHYSDQRFALELRYARAFSGSDIADRSVDEMRQVAAAELVPAVPGDRQAEAWRIGMRRAFPDVAAGDRLTGLHQPGGPTRFFRNGRATGEVAGAAFARLFFGIWLSPQTSEPGLRSQLLSGAT